MGATRRLLLPLALLLTLLIGAGARSLHVALHAAWRRTAVSAEALAWLSAQRSSSSSTPLFLSRLCAQIDADPSPSTSVQSEHDRVIAAVSPLLANQSLITHTFNWLLHSAQLSPLVALHFSTAQLVLSRFNASVSDTPPVFALRADAQLRSAQLITSVDHIHASCPSCPSISADTSLSFLRPLTREVILSTSSSRSSPFIFIFADVSTAQFCRWYTALTAPIQARSHRIVLRFWRPPQQQPTRSFNPSLQSFGVHVTLKSTEYKVVDDRVFDTKLFPECGYTDAACASTHPSNRSVAWLHRPDNVTFTPLQALQFITRHNAPQQPQNLTDVLTSLSSFVEDMPSVTRSQPFLSTDDYVNTTLEKQLARSVYRVRESIGERQYLFINSRPFHLSSLTRATEKLFRCLSSVSIASAHLPQLFADHVASDRVYASLHATPVRKSASLRVHLPLQHLVHRSLVPLNDLFSDSRYKKWDPLQLNSSEDIENFVAAVDKQRKKASSSDDESSSATTPSASQQYSNIVKVRAHHLSLQLIVDPGDVQQFAYLSIPQSVIQANLPIQVSVLLVPNGKTSSLIAAAFHYLLKLKGRKTAVRFLTMILEILEYLGAFSPVPLSPQLVDMAFSRVAAKEGSPYSSAAQVLEREADINVKLEEALRFAQDMNLFGGDSTSQEVSNEEDDQVNSLNDEDKRKRKMSMLCVLNGVVVKDAVSDVIPLAIAEQERIANLLKNHQVMDALLKANTTFDRWVAADPDLIVVQRLGKKMKTRERASTVTTSEDVLPPMTAAALFDLRTHLEEIRYIAPLSLTEPDTPVEHTTTVWLAGIDQVSDEFKTVEKILREVAQSDVAEKIRTRFAVLDPTSVINQEVLGCTTSISCLDEAVVVVNGKRLPASLFASVDDVVVELSSYFDGVDRSDLRNDDMRLVHRLHVNEISSACEVSEGETESEVTFSTVRDVVLEHAHSSMLYPEALGDGLLVSKPLSVLAVVDPTSPDAYVLTSLLEQLEKAFDSDKLALGLVVLPKSRTLRKKLELPKTYRRFVLQSVAAFQEESGNRLPPRASFFGLPQDRVLTVSVEAPRAWFVSSYATNYDMDNVVLETLPEGSTELHSEYELSNLIVEGSCIDEDESPPQGLKLYLENENGVSVDTIVMANLGYFQLKVPGPGLWNLRLADGRSSELYSLVGMEMYKELTKTVYRADEAGQVGIVIESFDGGGGILLRVARKGGTEGKSLLKSENEGSEKDKMSTRSAGGMLGKVKSGIANIYDRWMQQSVADMGNGDGSVRAKDNRIHVFSVASGHLYERFLKIMMTSATKHASRAVKFWLLENYLSPSFKKVLPLFAKEHGAEVGMVTYKWPGWLRAQTEKQRIIWAYKILFLDVLFPLDVERIIFVDSDQVLRGDLAELMDIDLRGAPYGYVPFCDSRKEVEGYRFWKSGFWKDTLRGAKYRISALYVVDLKRFRESAAGDTLRFIYQSLSADPNSLSNLDQDLPNYASSAASMGGRVRMFDLPQEWLWCESWCDDESKQEAKAIDLCNNPMTKEPKLQSAKRIISEWVGYDEAASALTEKLYGELSGGGGARDGEESIRREEKEEL
ncbi:UDP-glucose:glycoprotein glucosyltransferase [Gracilariopsis chorda]|uniref:UDP-glucose:glycoprotein glucosyltransferase n=1 Tax=Gracilariopsis chorda TaxID=448386 RepID=A0A2V3IIB2_9FLOR|nr:UDP-glucose:glycoprotein glucosyltransferase [Gracilariopsis chorda]|eukprot:PXF41826.1 UDP-glucose:glycoprotein glucosyltransferase [Gracilariopsis chorda]